MVGDALLLGSVVDGDGVGPVGTVHHGGARGEVEGPLVGLLGRHNRRLRVIVGTGRRSGEQRRHQSGQGGRMRGQGQRGRSGEELPGKGTEPLGFENHHGIGDPRVEQTS